MINAYLHHIPTVKVNSSHVQTWSSRSQPDDEDHKYNLIRAYSNYRVWKWGTGDILDLFHLTKPNTDIVYTLDTHSSVNINSFQWRSLLATKFRLFWSKLVISLNQLSSSLNFPKRFTILTKAICACKLPLTQVTPNSYWEPNKLHF